MEYKALTFITIGENSCAPGDTVTSDQLQEAGQTEDNIKELVDGGSLSENMNADINEAHLPPEPEAATEDATHVVATDEGSGTSAAG